MSNFGKLIEVQSEAFPRTAKDEELINSETMFGYALAHYIGERLPAFGMRVARYVAEDWGWYCELHNEGFALWYGVSNTGPDGFIIQIWPDKPVIRRWLKKVDVTSEVTALQDAIFAILTDDDNQVVEAKWIEK